MESDRKNENLSFQEDIAKVLAEESIIKDGSIMTGDRQKILEKFENGRQPEKYNLTIKSQENRVDFQNCKDDEGKLRICTNIVQETNINVEKIQEEREEDSKVLETPIQTGGTSSGTPLYKWLFGAKPEQENKEDFYKESTPKTTHGINNGGLCSSFDFGSPNSSGCISSW